MSFNPSLKARAEASFGDIARLLKEVDAYVDQIRAEGLKDREAWIEQCEENQKLLGEIEFQKERNQNNILMWEHKLEPYLNCVCDCKCGAHLEAEATELLSVDSSEIKTIPPGYVTFDYIPRPQ